MEPRSCFRPQRSWPALMLVLGAACVGPDPADQGVESATQAIQSGKLVPAGEAGFAAKIEQVMSDGKRLICTGAFISPHVVLTAAHCTRNYDYGSTITPTTDTVIRYGERFASSQKIAGGEKVGWRELGSTDIGLYRVAQAVSLPVTPKLYRNCATVNLVGTRVVVYGRMINGNQAPVAELYMSAERTVRAIANGVGANGNYVQIDSTTDSGDSGGPWVYSQDRIVAVTHTSAYGSRFCDVALEVETQVKEWGDTLVFVEDAAGGADGGTSVRDATKLDGAATSTSDAGSAGGRAGSGGGTGGTTGAGGGAGGSAGRASSSASAASGGTGGSPRPTSTGGSGANTGGQAAGGSAGGLSSSSAPGSASQAGAGAGGTSERSGGAQAGAKTDAQTSAQAGHRSDSESSGGSTAGGCGCRTLGDGRPGRPSATLALLLVLASAIALTRKGQRRQG